MRLTSLIFVIFLVTAAAALSQAAKASACGSCAGSGGPVEVVDKALGLAVGATGFSVGVRGLDMSAYNASSPLPFEFTLALSGLALDRNRSGCVCDDSGASPFYAAWLSCDPVAANLTGQRLFAAVRAANGSLISEWTLVRLIRPAPVLAATANVTRLEQHVARLTLHGQNLGVATPSEQQPPLVGPDVPEVLLAVLPDGNETRVDVVAIANDGKSVVVSLDRFNLTVGATLGARVRLWGVTTDPAVPVAVVVAQRPDNTSVLSCPSSVRPNNTVQCIIYIEGNSFEVEGQPSDFNATLLPGSNGTISALVLREDNRSIVFNYTAPAQPAQASIRVTVLNKNNTNSSYDDIRNSPHKFQVAWPSPSASPAPSPEGLTVESGLMLFGGLGVLVIIFGGACAVFAIMRRRRPPLEDYSLVLNIDD